MFWGASPALDLHKEINVIPGKILNILLIGTIDARHIIKTISQRYKYENIQYNFYVSEKWLEQVARQVLFLNIILEDEKELGFFEKIRIFMELYGNTFIRPPVSRYLYKKSAQLIEAITDANYAQRTMPIFNFDQLKYKERDYMENIFKFWARPDSQFQIQKAWDFRVRKSLGVRYDNRKGAFDWDYHMRLCEIGGDIIFSREYINWRGSGIAFTWLETDGSKPNLTLAAGILGNGLKLHHHGYLGDIHTGPFIGYGIECDDIKMFEKANREYKNRSTDVTEWNLAHIIHEICTNTPYTDETFSIGTGIKCAYMQFPDIKTDLYDDFEPDKFNPQHALPLMPASGVNISYVSMSHLPLLHNKDMYNNLFDIIVFSNEQINCLNRNLIKTVKTGAPILVETRKFLIEQTRDEIKKFGDEIKERATECQLEERFEFDPMKDAYARFEIVE